MRILAIGINYAPDVIGVAKYNTELCESLAAKGHEVRMITAPPYYPDWKIVAEYNSGWYRRERQNNVELVRAPIYVPNRPSGTKRLLHHASFLLSAVFPALWAAVRWRPDVIFAVAPSLLSAPIGSLAAKMTGAASWLHIQDLEIDAAFELGMLQDRHQLRKIMHRLESSILGSFDRVSTISPQMTQRLSQRGHSLDNMREIRNWVDTEIIVPGPRQTKLRSDLGLKGSDVVALYSGAMSNKQGLELVIEAARNTRTRNPSLQFVLCGNGPAKSKLMQMAAAAENVRFIDLQPLERLSELLSTADIHLLPQKAQVSDLVLPSKLAGMLASGRPIVAMAEPETRLAQETETAGILVPPGDAKAFADAIMVLADDESTRIRFGAAARQLAQQRWERTAIIRSIELEFLSLMQRGTTPTAPHPTAPHIGSPSAVRSTGKP